MKNVRRAPQELVRGRLTGGKEGMTSGEEARPQTWERDGGSWEV